MGEKAKSIGEKLEGFGEKLFEGFGWNEIIRDLEIQCKKSTHKNKADKSKRTHGVDLLHRFNDPYINQTIGVITECKNRTWAGIGKGTIQQWFNELVNTIECTKNSNEIKDLDLHGANINTGILLINCNDGKFDKEKFYEYLSMLEITNKRDPINIFIAGNDKIDQWHALLKKIQFYKSQYSDSIFKIVYPSIENSKRSEEEYITVTHLFSRYVFAVHNYYIEESSANIGMTNKIARRRYVIFSFDKHTKDSFKYLCSMFKYFQLEEGQEYVFCFYPQKAEDIEYINNNFIKSLKDSNGKEIIDATKIKIEFLENRNINPVEYSQKV